MTDFPHSDWMNQWQALSRQALGAWQDMARGPDAKPAFAAPAWPPGLEQMARVFPAGGAAQNGTIEQLVDSAKAYAAFMQSMLGSGMQGFGSSMHGTSTPDWGDAFRKGFASMGGGAAMPAGVFGQAAMPQWPGMTGGPSDPFEQIRRAMGNLEMPSVGGLGDFKSMLDLPAFGPKRESQENQQKSALAWIDYQQHMARYNALMLKAGQRGYQLFEGKLIEREQPGRQIDSMRALYDLWVDAAEEGYAEIALSIEFREVYGAMVNAQMRVRSQVQQEVERIAAEFGMPTRSEINSIGKRLQALRREVRERAAGEGLADEVAALRSEVAALKAQTARQPRAATREPVEPKSRVASTSAVSKRRDPALEETRVAIPAKSKAVARIADESGQVKRKKRSRTQSAAAAPVQGKKRKGGKGTKREQKAVAALATGSFASRIEKFATASRSTANPKAGWKLAEKSADPKKKSRH